VIRRGSGSGNESFRSLEFYFVVFGAIAFPVKRIKATATKKIIAVSAFNESGDVVTLRTELVFLNGHNGGGCCHLVNRRDWRRQRGSSKNRTRGMRIQGETGGGWFKRSRSWWNKVFAKIIRKILYYVFGKQKLIQREIQKKKFFHTRWRISTIGKCIPCWAKRWETRKSAVSLLDNDVLSTDFTSCSSLTYQC
jgi:hypothetical protein